MRLAKNLIALLTLATFSYCASAQDADGGVDRTVQSPSPDGRFAFLVTRTPDQGTCDLIGKDSGKVLLRIAESEEDSNQLSVDVLWSPDSKRFAITEVFHNRRMNDLAVYFRDGDIFREVKLPELPEASLPEKLGGDSDHFWHMNVCDWKTPVRWRKDGTLVVEIETTMDGNGNYATAKRTVVLGFEPTGAASILKSSQKVTSHIEE